MEINREQWKTAFEKSPNATFFHSPEWFEIWQKYDGWKIKIIYYHKENDEVYIPFAYKNKLNGLFKFFLSSPTSIYGGGFTTQSPSRTPSPQILKWLKKHAWIRLVDNPFYPILPTSYPVGRGSTQLIDLDHSWEKIEHGMKKGRILAKVKKAEQNGLILKQLKATEIKSFFEIYSRMRTFWETPTNDYRLNLFHYLFHSPLVEFWGIYTKEGQLIGGGPFLKSNLHVSSWLPVVLPEYRPQRPYEFFFFHLMKKFKKEGKLKWFDFNPSGGHAGVETI